MANSWREAFGIGRKNVKLGERSKLFWATDFFGPPCEERIR